jgi:hypothetical protein
MFEALETTWVAKSAMVLMPLLATAGCAQSAGSAAGVRSVATADRVVGNPGAGHSDMTYYFDDTAVVSVIDAAPNDLWAHLLNWYEALGLAPDVQDSRSLTVGVREAMLRRTLGERRISTFMSCGRDMTGELADRSTIRLWMVTRLVPTEDGRTQIRTELTANATDNDGTSRSIRPCSSNHRLEMSLAQDVAVAIAPDG